MLKFSEIDSSICNIIRSKIESQLRDCWSLEQAAQKFIDSFYEEFEESLVIARMFMSVPYANLPQFNQKFVTNLVEEKGVTSEMQYDTLVLSLLGTRGEEPDWNDRRKSKGHVGIPLVSTEFVEATPMLARLLSDFGLGLDWLKKPYDGWIIDRMGDIAGTFFVPDAKESVDSKKRKIIPMQDFVEAYNVHTVFGIGGRYMLGSNNIIAAIFFTKENFDKKIARSFQPLINWFKMTTIELVGQQRIFSD